MSSGPGEREMSIKVTFCLSGGRAITARCSGTRTNLMEIARLNNVPGVSGTCGGLMACGSCHLYIGRDWVPVVGEASREEREIIDLATSPTPESRLGCQVWITPETDGLQVGVPET